MFVQSIDLKIVQNVGRLESMLVQYEVVECFIKCNDSEILSQLRTTLERNNVAWQASPSIIANTVSGRASDPMDARLDVLNELRDLAFPTVEGENDGLDVWSQLNGVQDCTIDAVQAALQGLDLWKKPAQHHSYEVTLGMVTDAFIVESRGVIMVYVYLFVVIRQCEFDA